MEKTEDFDDMQLKAELDEITKAIDDIIERVAEYEMEISSESGESDP